jgi:hypothetical protein
MKICTECNGGTWVLLTACSCSCKVKSPTVCIMDFGTHILMEAAEGSSCGNTTQPVDLTRFLMVTVSFWYARESPAFDRPMRGLGEIFNT